MFRTEKSVRVLQAVAAIAGLAVLLWSLGLPSLRFADAANVTDFSDTLTDSATSTVAAHTLNYAIPTGSAGVESGETISVTFPPEFTGTSSVTLADLDLEKDTVDETVVSGAPGAAEWQFSWSGNTLSFLSGGAGATFAANATVTIKIGSSADGGTDRLVNPGTAASYKIDLVSGDGGNNDTGSTRVVILAPVTITASVDTRFDFTVAGLGGGETVNGTTTTGTSTATTIPFGALQAGGVNATTSAQRLTVITNASQGYTVTLQIDDTLISSTGADIDLFDEGSENDVPAPWSSPTPVVGSDNTYGHWGVTSEDATANRGADEFGSDEWIAASTTPRNIMGSDGPADGTVAGNGETDVGFKVEITALQEAGDDYQAILTYVATPTF